jgi:uncharacterized membrane protein YidH (DUF202 family)
MSLCSPPIGIIIFSVGEIAYYRVKEKRLAGCGIIQLLEKRMETENNELSQLVVNEVQIVLAEKRTSLAQLRTGIAVFAFPLSVLSVLVATSKYYNVADILELFIPLILLCAGLVVLGTYLVQRSVFRIRHHDQIIAKLKKANKNLAEFVD